MATVRSNKMLAQLEIDYLDLILREKRLRWFGYVKRFSVAIKTVCDIQKYGECGLGRFKTTWMTLTERDCREWKPNEFDPCDRVV